VFGLDIFRTRILVFLGSATFALLSPKARNRIHGAIVLITRATPRVAATIETVNLCIESTLSSEHPNPMSALKYDHRE
jgi:hypothetical protein